VADAPEAGLPPLTAVYLYPTGQCNQRCRHCWVEAPHVAAAREEARLPVGDLVALLTPGRALGLEWVKITGGEPFLRPDLLDLVAALRGAGLEVEIETNGTLVDEAAAVALAAAEVRQVAVSLDGAHPETHDALRRQTGAFDRAVAALRRLVARGVAAQVLCTLGRANAGEIDALLDLCADLGVGSFKLNFLAPMGRGAALHAAGAALPAAAVLAMARHVEEERGPGLPFEASTALPLAFVSRARLRAGEGHLCPVRQILGLLADGRAALCGVGYQAPALVLGDLRRTPLATVWRDSPVLRELRGGLHRRLGGVCGRCLLRGSCLGACRASAYLRSGSLSAPFWLCEEAAAAGLFPASRLEAG
jgi:SynChlorMet cassette radical SAM/SPASM protein ScmF